MVGARSRPKACSGRARCRCIAPLTDEIGARLTGSPAHKQAADWARDRFMEFGLTNPISNRTSSAGVAARTHVGGNDRAALLPLIAYREAWTPSTKGVDQRARRLRRRQERVADSGDGGQLRGAIVLTHLPQTEWVERDRPQPGSTTSRCDRQPDTADARSTTPSA
jgi:hypothetical protein